jgi:hypothetical protein
VLRNKSAEGLKKKLRANQCKLVFVDVCSPAVVVDHSDATEDLFPEDLVNPFGDLGSQVKLFDTFCAIGICKKPCLRCLRVEKITPVSVSTEVVPFAFSWFNVQTPVGVTHNTIEFSNCDEIIPSLEVVNRCWWRKVKYL